MGNDDVLPAWRTVIELCQAGVGADLTLVGGLMVYVHAVRGGVVAPRSTDDADFLVDFMGNQSSLKAAWSTLGSLGFQLDTDGPFAYHFDHPDGRKVDVMVPDHLPSKIGLKARLSKRPVLTAEAGQQAVQRRDIYTLHFNSGAAAVVGVPDELGALVAKGAAYLIDQRDRARHLGDAATLLASITDVSTISFDSVSKNDRKRIRAVYDHLADETHPGWVNLGQEARTAGQFNLAIIADQARL